MFWIKRYFFITCCLIFLLFVNGCEEKSANQETGVLTGKITIGPLCPVEEYPTDPACLPTAETYKAYPVSIWDEMGRFKVAPVTPALDGTYRLTLAPATYLMVLENKPLVAGCNLPVKVTIYPAQESVLEISIDTGIR